MGSKRSFRTDERGIEGLPIRLVIALVVGVAALGIMMNMLGGIGTPGKTEVRVQYSDGAVVETSELPKSGYTIKVVGEDGQPVEGARVIVSGGTAQLNSPITPDTQTSADGTIDVDLNGVSLRADQTQGTLKVEVIPPSNSNWADDQSNTEIRIVEG